LNLNPSDVDGACTQLLRCQYLANYVGSPPPITLAQLVLVIPFADGWLASALVLVHI
jgi:hypothetical protein